MGRYHKMTSAEKLEIIDLYLNHNYSIARIERDTKLHKGIIKDIFNEYNIQVRKTQRKHELGDQYIGDFHIIKAISSPNQKKTIWECVCVNCGKIKNISTTMLVSSRGKKRCECHSGFGKRESVGYLYDLSGEVFGELTVLGYAGRQHSHSLWQCRCSCGETCIKSITSLHKSKNKMCDKCSNKAFSDKIAKKNFHRNNIEVCEGVATINGNVVVDEVDLPMILSYRRYVSINNGGYAYIKHNGSELFIHRLLLGLPQKYDKISKEIGDHINGDRLDNRRSNLRILHKSQNAINVGIYSNNTSGYKGVSWLKNIGKWQVSIQVNKKPIYIGVYADKFEAISKRQEAEKFYFGDLNRARFNDGLQ